jgi:small subunit ribosomal protein S1
LTKNNNIQFETPSADFDWSMDKAGFGNYSKDERTTLESLYEQTLSTIAEKEIVKGTVVGFTEKEVVLNIGFKSDGLIARTEFRDMPELKVGDVVEVLLENKEDALGQLVLSRKKAMSERAWDNIMKCFENDEIVNGYVKTRTKGGLVVELFGIDTFLPGSQIDTKPIKDYDIYVGQTMPFKVVKVNHQFKNVVISHKVLIEEDIEKQKSDILSKLEKGQVLEGTVKNMTSFGVFIDLGGVDGLLHITDISWGRINHPEEVLKMDQKINIVVLDFDDEKKRISLGLKQLSSHPWDSLAETLVVGATVKGKIVNIADYGAFLEIAPGVEGLIHVSEMSWSQHLRSPQDFMKLGDEVEAVILTLEKEERKMSLGIKQLKADPWVNITEKYPVGSRHKGVVRNMTNYGLFVELEEGVDGLVHVSDLSWTKKIKHPAEFVKKDQELDVMVLEVDLENRRLSLGHKQLDENPWDTFETIFTVGSEHEGTVLKIEDKSATIALPYGVEGYAPIKQLQREDKTTAKEDEVVMFKVTEFNKENKRIVVSHTALWKADAIEEKKVEEKKRTDDKEKTAKAAKKINDGNEKSTFADVEGLAALKAQLEKKD